MKKEKTLLKLYLTNTEVNALFASLVAGCMDCPHKDECSTCGVSTLKHKVDVLIDRMGFAK